MVVIFFRTGLSKLLYFGDRGERISSSFGDASFATKKDGLAVKFEFDRCAHAAQKAAGGDRTVLLRFGGRSIFRRKLY